MLKVVFALFVSSMAVLLGLNSDASADPFVIAAKSCSARFSAVRESALRQAGVTARNVECSFRVRSAGPDEAFHLKIRRIHAGQTSRSIRKLRTNANGSKLFKLRLAAGKSHTLSVVQGDVIQRPAVGASCADLANNLAAEESSLRACSSDSDCGQVLKGTSCGCTNDLVARVDADVTVFNSLIAQAKSQNCDVGLVTDCSCREAQGFKCDNGTCQWRYADVGIHLN